jgi:hypothetical protein
MADWFSCLADTKSRVSCFTADLDLADANMADQQEGAPSAIRQIYGPGLEFWAQQPIKTCTTHIQPTTRRHLAPGDF